MLKLFEKCPACGGPIVITECKCPNCQLVMRGEFAPGQFSALSEDQFTFIRAFLRVRGNLSELEKVLGISYPTIRNKLDEINQSLEQADTQTANHQNEAAALSETRAQANDNERQAILQQVSAGNINASEALQLLRNLRGG